MNDTQETESQIVEHTCAECGEVMYRMISKDGKVFRVDRDILEWDPENLEYFTECPSCRKRYKAAYERAEGTPGYQLSLSPRQASE